MTAALLTLADSRLPAGGHTHSGGVEQAIAAVGRGELPWSLRYERQDRPARAAAS